MYGVELCIHCVHFVPDGGVVISTSVMETSPDTQIYQEAFMMTCGVWCPVLQVSWFWLS